jgi:hypothetical protein
MSTVAVMIALGGTSYAATQLGRGSVTSRAIRDGAVHTADLAKNAVTNRKLANGAVTNGKLANGAVTNRKLANSAVTGANVANRSLTGSAFKCQAGDLGLDNRNMCFFDLHTSQGATWAQAIQMCRARGSTPATLASPAEIAAAAPLGGSPFRSVLMWSSQIASSTGAYSTASAYAVQTDANGNVTLIVSTPLTSSTIEDVACVYHAADVF